MSSDKNQQKKRRKKVFTTAGANPHPSGLEEMALLLWHLDWRGRLKYGSYTEDQATYAHVRACISIRK